MILSEVLSELAKVYHLPSLKLNAYGKCTLVINETLPISFETALAGTATLSEGFFVYAVVGQLADKVEASEVLSYLNANLFGSQTGRATLGYDSHTHSLVLFEYFNENALDFPSFLARFTLFTGYAAYWLTRMEIPLPQVS